MQMSHLWEVFLSHQNHSSTVVFSHMLIILLAWFEFILAAYFIDMRS